VVSVMMSSWGTRGVGSGNNVHHPCQYEVTELVQTAVQGCQIRTRPSGDLSAE
jgi:hypothetical protein